LNESKTLPNPSKQNKKFNSDEKNIKNCH